MGAQASRADGGTSPRDVEVKAAADESSSSNAADLLTRDVQITPPAADSARPDAEASGRSTHDEHIKDRHVPPGGALVYSYYYASDLPAHRARLACFAWVGAFASAGCAARYGLDELAQVMEIVGKPPSFTEADGDLAQARRP